MDLAPATVLDRYELVRHVGSGGMGSVWLARMAGAFGFRKDVAIKVILPALARDQHQRKMFLDEARVAGRLRHPNVAQVLDVCEAEDVLFQVIEWVDGPTLSALARAAEQDGRSLPLGIALRIVADAASGAHAAHELRDERGKRLGVIHRDLAPQNVMVDASGVSKLIDFGIAQSTIRQATATKTGFARGHASYLAPEQAMRFGVDRRADVWALGATLYRVLAGRPPFDNAQQLVDHVYGKAPLTRLPREVPAPVRELVARTLAVEPRHRYASAEEARDAIEGAMRSIGQVTTHADVGRYLRPRAPPARGRTDEGPTV